MIVKSDAQNFKCNWKNIPVKMHGSLLIQKILCMGHLIGMWDKLSTIIGEVQFIMSLKHVLQPRDYLRIGSEESLVLQTRDK